MAIGNVNANVDVQQYNTSNEGAGSKTEVSGKHTHLGAVSVQGMDASFLEEAAMNIASSRKIENKDDKKDKDTLKKLLEEQRQKVPDIPGEEALEQCLHHLMSEMESGNLEEDDIRQALEEYSGDATHQYLALEDLIKYLKEQDDADQNSLVERLEAYKENFYTENEQDIKAGLNISELAHTVAEDSSLGDTGDLRDIWRQALNIPEMTSAIMAYNFALERVQGEVTKVDEGIQWMVEALSREFDLTQTERSASPEHMVHVRKQLEYVFGTRTMIDFCASVEKKIPKVAQSE